MNSKIYIMSHKRYISPKDELYEKIHVGKEGKEDLGFGGDNTGDNISAKNANFCELTGVYWLWKNVDIDNIGICHYRRYFIKEGLFLNKNYIESILQSYDMILPKKVLWKETVYEQYKKYHKEKDMIEVKNIIEEKYPEYLKAFNHVMSGHSAYLANMIITRKNIFDEYCQWLFDILFELERRIDISDYDNYQRRVFGFLSERLLNVWVANHEFKIREEYIGFLEE